MFETDNGRPFWEGKNFSFNQNKDCEYFPCHKTEHPEDFNCLFCYCPLYALGSECGGAFKYTEDGTKDCSGCLVPHRKDAYGRVIEHFSQLRELALKNKK